LSPSNTEDFGWEVANPNLLPFSDFELTRLGMKLLLPFKNTNTHLQVTLSTYFSTKVNYSKNSVLVPISTNLEANTCWHVQRDSKKRVLEIIRESTTISYRLSKI
jgi:hypothetical protein